MILPNRLKYFASMQTFGNRCFMIKKSQKYIKQCTAGLDEPVTLN